MIEAVLEALNMPKLSHVVILTGNTFIHSEYNFYILFRLQEFDGKSVSFSDIPHHFLEKILNVMNLALEVEHAHMLQVILI